MKKLFGIITVVAVAVTLISCTEEFVQPNNNPPSETPPDVYVQFTQDYQLVENQSVVVEISLDKPAAQNGVVRILISDNLKSLVSTNPQHENGILSIPVQQGSNTGNFSLWALDDYLDLEDAVGTFQIDQLSMGLSLGAKSTMNLLIQDNDITIEIPDGPKKLHSWSTGTTGRTYEYDANGRISNIYWVTSTVGGTYKYYYDENGIIDRVNHYEGKDVYYLKENGKIIRSETIQFDVLKQYTLYEYDFEGKIGATATYHLQENGEFLNTNVVVYLYHLDGNIYKKIVYAPTVDGEELLEIETHTYEHYFNNTAIIPVLEIIPTFAANSKLPGKYTYSRDGLNYNYSFTYEFDNSGNVTKRVASSVYGTEVTSYTYY